MRNISIYLAFLFFLTCAKEDSQDSKIYSSFSGPQYTLSITAGSGGRFNAAACPAATEDACRNIFHNSTRLETAKVSFPAGTYVTIRAFPNEGYTLASWSNGLTEEIIVVFLDSNKDVEVYFTQD
tara:strand:- start:1247 stop:1621 length:375 start_codon:yes stop_codon:yes gene_type:complete